MDTNDQITADSFEMVVSLCFRIAIFGKLENVPSTINQLAWMVRKMRRIVTMREQGVDQNEIIRKIKGPLLKVPVDVSLRPK